MIRFATRTGPISSGETSRSSAASAQPSSKIYDMWSKRWSCRLPPVPRTVGIGLVGFGWMGGSTELLPARAEHFPACAGPARLVIAADETDARPRAADALGYERWTTDWRDVIATRRWRRSALPHRTASTARSPWPQAPRASTSGARSPSGVPRPRPPTSPRPRAAGVRTIVGFNYRQAPAVQHAARLISSGALGRVPSTARSSSPATPRTRRARSRGDSSGRRRARASSAT